MRTAHPRSTTERRERAAATQAVQQAIQEAMDRRDNGGETGH
jgi:hypothetical protein